MFFSSINGKPCPLYSGPNLSHLIKHFTLLGIHSLSSLRNSFPKSCCRVDENCLSLLKQNKTKPTSFYCIISLKLLIHFLLPFTGKILKTKQNKTLPHRLSHLIVSFLDHGSSGFHIRHPTFALLSSIDIHPPVLPCCLSPNVDKDGCSPAPEMLSCVLSVTSSWLPFHFSRYFSIVSCRGFFLPSALNLGVLWIVGLYFSFLSLFPGVMPGSTLALNPTNM